MWCICDYIGLETFSSNLTITRVSFNLSICWGLIHWWNLNVRNYCDHLKLIMTTYFCYAGWVETCRSLSGQELSNNSSSFCSSRTQTFHLPMYLCDYSFLMMRWNHKWGLGWRLYCTSSSKFSSFHKPKQTYLQMPLVTEDQPLWNTSCFYFCCWYTQLFSLEELYGLEYIRLWKIFGTMEIAFFTHAVLATFSPRAVGKFYIPSFQPVVTQWNGQGRCSVADFCVIILLILYAVIDLVNGMSCWFGHFWMTKYSLPVVPLQHRHYNRFAIQYLSRFLDITGGAWTSVRNSVRVTFCQSLVARSKRLDPLSSIAHRGHGSWAMLLVSRCWKYSTLCILIFWNFRMYMPYWNKFAYCSKSLHLMNVSLKSINLTSRVSITKWNTIGFFKLLILRFRISAICSKYLWNLLYRHTITSWTTHYVISGSLAIPEQAASRIQIVSYSGFGKFFTSELILPRRDPSFSSTSWCVY